jgi:monoamine oxidase
VTQRIPRRAFLRDTLAAVGAFAIAPPLAFLSSHATTPARRVAAGRPPKRVIVVGAGLAGLAATYELTQAGHDVTLLEARMRSGGRVHTLREPFSDGLYAEAGAMFAGGPHTMRYLEEFGIRLVPPASKDLAFLYVVGNERLSSLPGEAVDWPVALSPEERRLGLNGIWQKYVYAVVKEVGDPLADGWPQERLREYDDMSFADFLVSRGASPAAISIMRLQVIDLYGDGIETVSALEFLSDMASRPLQASSGGGVFDGGSDVLPEAFAGRLADRIHYGAAVVRIMQDADRVRAFFERAGQQHSVEADRLVCTIPFSVLRHLELSPPLSPEKQRIVDTLQYSSITRVYLQVRRRYWEDEGLSGLAYTDLPVPRILVHPIARRTTRGIIEAHTGKAQARQLAELSEDQRIAFALEQVERIHPGIHDHFEGGASYSWVDDPWARGGYSSFRPGDFFRFGPHIAQPEGRIHFAGEHTSRLSASMEAALESGDRVAREIGEAA